MLIKELVLISDQSAHVEFVNLATWYAEHMLFWDFQKPNPICHFGGAALAFSLLSTFPFYPIYKRISAYILSVLRLSCFLPDGQFRCSHLEGTRSAVFLRWENIYLGILRQIYMMFLLSTKKKEEIV